MHPGKKVNACQSTAVTRTLHSYPSMPGHLTEAMCIIIINPPKPKYSNQSYRRRSGQIDTTDKLERRMRGKWGVARK